MKIKPPNSHYTPTLANKEWAVDKKYISYIRNKYTNKIEKETKGYKQWGSYKGLYTWKVENSLNEKLETKVSYIYRKILQFENITLEERIVWSQFLLSQLVRTPSYIHYENFFKEALNIFEEPLNNRVGCPECMDINYVSNRNWCLLIAHEDDYFIRTDNPVLQTGFIEELETCLYYPLSPKVCFVACSMKEGWDAFKTNKDELYGFELKKGVSGILNFYFSKTADKSIIISPKYENHIANAMFLETLGIYPQAPFSLHSPNFIEYKDAYSSILMIMSKADGQQYPKWDVSEIEPFYGK